MDLLSQYKQDHPEAFQEKKPSSLTVTDEYGREYSGMIALVMRASGGRVRDATNATYILLVVVGVLVLMSVMISWFSFPSGSSAKRESVPAGAHPSR